MKPYKTYIKSMCQGGTIAAAAALLLLSTGCERRELWVYQDNYKQVEIDVDWRNYYREWAVSQLNQLNNGVKPAQDPGGMTVYLFPRDGRTSYRYTTAEVRHFETYMSKGEYDGLVFDYSPEEYGHQEFVGMDFANTAKVQSTVASYQADSIPDLYGDAAYGGSKSLPLKNENGFYAVVNEPEDIASDTCYMNIYTGKYDKYIPYKEREDYQNTLTSQTFNMEPWLIPWNMRIRIYVKGIYYLWKVQATLAGMADGYMLVDCKTSDQPCLLQLDNWEVHITGDNVGYIASTFKTWGPMNFENRNWDCHVAQRELSNSEYLSTAAINGYSYEELSNRNPEEIRLNLRFLLRDRHTAVYYHADVANLVHVFRNEYALRVDLLDEDGRVPVLPFVEAYNGMEFGGIVIPWADEDPVDVIF